MGATISPGPVQTEARRLAARDRSIDYLRTVLTLMVIAHHSSLAYTSWASFNKQHMFRSTAPVVDSTRWAFFDYAENFNDVFFMSLMFFVSGLFVYSALRRHGSFGFMRDRLLRLGVPFAFAVTVLMPIAYYASWQLTGRSIGFLDFYQRLAEDGFAAGPPWFIWVLLLFDLVLGAVVLPWIGSSPATDRVEAGSRRLRSHPFAVFCGILFLAGLVYLPLLARFGFGAWTVLFTSPFAFQICRIGLYALWFVFGFFVGSAGLSSGLLSREGALTRYWLGWIAGCAVAYNALWFIPRWSATHRLLGAGTAPLEAVLWVISCVASCFGFLALFRGLDLRDRAWMNSLSRSAYVMYLVHYVFVLWLQRLLLDRSIHAGIKFLFVFLAASLLSWLTAQIVLRVPGLKSIL